MRHLTFRLAITTLTASLALMASTAPKANAAAVQSYIYYTDGNVSGGNSSQPISFQGVGNSNNYYNNGYYYGATYSTITTPGIFTLGNFVTSGILPPTATLTYNNTPFTIDVHVGTLPASSGNANYTYDYKLSGMLNGSVTGNGQSTMMASVTSITGSAMPAYYYNTSVNNTPPFPISALQVNAAGIAPAYGYQSTSTALTAQVVAFPTAQPTPEPTSIAAFLTAIVGWKFRRRLLAKV